MKLNHEKEDLNLIAKCVEFGTEPESLINKSFEEKKAFIEKEGHEAYQREILQA